MKNPASNAPGLHMGQMRLQVPGTTVEAGHRIAQQTTSLLRAAEAGLPAQHLGAMKLRITAPPGATEAELSHAISRAVLRHLNRSHHA